MIWQCGILGMAVQKSAPAAVTAMYTGVTQSLIKMPLGKVRHLPHYSASWPDLKKRFFNPKASLIVSKCVQVKGRVAFRHPTVGRRPAKPGESVKYHYTKSSFPHLPLSHRYKCKNLNFLLSPPFLPIYFHIVSHLAEILQSNKTHLAIDEIVLPIV